MGLGRANDCPGTKVALWAIFRKRWRVGNAFLGRKLGEGGGSGQGVGSDVWGAVQVGLVAFRCFLAMKLTAQPSHSHICGANLRPLNTDMAPSFYKLEPG
jgi:hypothetical protein